MGCYGRIASYLTAPAQIPACGTTALGSSEILASVKDKLVLPSLLFPAVRFASFTLSFHRVDLPYVKELIGSPKFFISLYRHAMCQDPGRPSLESYHMRFFCIGFRYENDVAICINLYLRGYNSLLGSTVFPIAYLFLCVRII